MQASQYIYDVYISYSHSDFGWITGWLLPKLEDAGLRICIDVRDFEIGVPRLVNIERAVEYSRYTLIILSPDWVADAWAEFHALLVQTTDPAARQHRLLPLLLQPCQPPLRIAMLTHADFTQPEKWSAQLLRVIGEVRSERLDPKLNQFSQQNELVQSDRTLVLIELPFVTNSYALYDIVNQQPYNYDSTSALREYLGICETPSHVLNMAASIIVDAWSTHPRTVGIFATLLSAKGDDWKPELNLLEKLHTLCEASLDDEDITQVGIVEPLAFALALKGFPVAHRKFLRSVVSSKSWRDADFQRISKYYGPQGVQLSAIIRHLRDVRRTGLLQANDVARLLHLATTSSALGNVRRQTVVERLLYKSITALQTAHEETLVKAILDEMNTIKNLAA